MKENTLGNSTEAKTVIFQNPKGNHETSMEISIWGCPRKNSKIKYNKCRTIVPLYKKCRTTVPLDNILKMPKTS